MATEVRPASADRWPDVGRLAGFERLAQLGPEPVLVGRQF